MASQPSPRRSKVRKQEPVETIKVPVWVLENLWMVRNKIERRGLDNIPALLGDLVDAGKGIRVQDVAAMAITALCDACGVKTPQPAKALKNR